MNGYLSIQDGQYYEGDKIHPDDVAVPNRPTRFHIWNGAEWVQDNDALKADVKARAEALLRESDWAALPDVENLTNKADWLTYRAALRAIAVTPTVDAAFPAKPAEVWG